jgi:hypothetical protein
LAVNKNSNGSYDLGISQQNSKFVFETASRAGIKAFDPMNPKHSIKVCIVKLAGLRDYWINQGYDSQESLFWLILGSYNRGVSGMKRYIKYNGTLQTDYALKVAKWKEQLEVEGGLD